MMLFSCYLVTLLLALRRKGNDWKQTFLLMLLQGMVLGPIEVVAKLCYLY